MNYSVSEPLSNVSTLVDLLRLRADQQPDLQGFTFLLDGEDTEATLTYQKLDQKARTIAAWLLKAGSVGDRALLLYPPGLEYIEAFLGCLYAGVTAVPAYPPHRNRPTPRLQAIVADAQPRFALTTSETLAALPNYFATMPELMALEWAAPVDMPEDQERAWQPPSIDGSTLAFLQYTSGSTSQPKGVMVSHANLLHNLSHIHRCFGHGPESRGVIWLPPYHDMGLIGGVLQPLYGGFPVVLMSPVAFLQRPVRWLQAISKYHATTSGGPNFAYDLCARKITPEQRLSLDLSSWTVAFNGAEPIHQATLDAFASTFEPHGFRRAALYPCYGLAEATLIVAGGNIADEPVIARVQSEELERNQVVDASEASGGTRLLVGSGQPFSDQQTIIANPETFKRCQPGEVGEIWVAGPSVAQGYWNNEEATQANFQAYLTDTQAGPFLRTGDLGFFKQDELFVTGRLKDMIIVRGRNYYPQDIERTVEQCHPGLRPGCGAAFSVEIDQQECLIVVQEVERHFRQTDLDGAIDHIRRAVVDEFSLYVSGVVLVRTGSVPKTTSGKIQRGLCRSQFLENNLKIISSSLRTQSSEFTSEELSRDLLLATPPQDRQKLLESYLCAQIARYVGLTTEAVDAHQPLTGIGLDSLMAIEVQHALEATLDVALPLAVLLQSPSIAQLSSDVLMALSEPVEALEGALVPVHRTAAAHPLSYGQQALWFLHQLAPDSSAYNITSAVRLKAELDRAALGRALQVLVERHPALRTTFPMVDSSPIQRIHDRLDIDVQHTDVSSWNTETLNQQLANSANQPFDLVQGPLLRLQVFSRSSSEHILLIAIHHIIADFWSLALLIQELGELYQAETTGGTRSLPTLPVQYTDYVYWERTMLASTKGEQLWSYWQRQLAGHLPVINLPTDRSRPPVQTYAGASQSLRLSPELAERLKTLSRNQGCTLYVTLLSTYFVLLHRYTDQEDLLVGSPTVGRASVAVADVLGYFINPVVLRAHLTGNLSFLDVLEQTRRTVHQALEHHTYPFALLAERLQPERDPSRSPLFQVMFSLQQAPHHVPAGLATLALNANGVSLDLAGLPVESVALEQRAAQFDLQLTMAELDEGLGATFHYNTDLFDHTTIGRMVGHFETLLHGLAANPERSIGSLPLLTKAERDLLRDWNATFADYSSELCIHSLFEAQAARTPEAIALVFGNEQISFQTLNQRANQLAYQLQKLGVAPGHVVGLYVGRSPEMIVGLLAILKAGAAYLPLDPSYPTERLQFMLEDAGVVALCTQSALAQRLATTSPVVHLDSGAFSPTAADNNNPTTDVSGAHVAYVIYTSGSTGKPKGVMVTHSNVVNFFVGMDQQIGAEPGQSLLAVTSISFDISVLELFWTLTRGCKVVLLSEQAISSSMVAEKQRARPDKEIRFSLFYFASDDGASASDKYRLLMEGAKFADQQGFAAVWTPERHFHAFGGLYPNPSVTGAALAAITQHVHIRAGSVVLPLHNPIRVAEEWAVVDNISHGRVGLAFASGWHADDFALYPAHYSDRKAVMDRGIETVQQLWRGEKVSVLGGGGNEIEVNIFPKPIQAELPVWITAAGNAETFIKAGQMGANILTHLLGQSLEEVAEKIRLYRDARAEHGHDPDAGQVTLMLHTFIGPDHAAVREQVRVPFTNYLRSSIGLIENLIRTLKLPLDIKRMSPKDLDDLLTFAFERYFETSALFGTPTSCLPMIDQLKTIGVDEVACLIDFGVEADVVLEHLEHLAALKQHVNQPHTREDYSLAAQAARFNAMLLQCTPSYMQILSQNPEVMASLRSLRALLLGGEALPLSLARQMKQELPARLINMYGPTETTIWSATHEFDATADTVTIGRPIANTQLYVLDHYLQPLPVGVPGELYIGGAGVSYGYLNRPELTAEKLIPDPFSDNAGARLYKTGDLARYLADGTLDVLGRADYQVKLRGFRIELGEIEAVLGQHPQVREAIVTAHEQNTGNKQLVAYIVASPQSAPDASELRDFVRAHLPEYMVPGMFITLDALPLTSNGKVDRKALPAPSGSRPALSADYEAPRSKIEQTIAHAWQQALNVERVGVHDNFFDLGGHSLLMAQVHSQLRETLQQDVPLIKMLEHPTISALATYLSQHQNDQPSFQQSQDRAQKQRSGLMRQRQRLKQN